MMKINFLIVFLLVLLCSSSGMAKMSREERYHMYGMHFEEDTQYEFLRYEQLKFEELGDYRLTELCEAAQQACYNYLRCNFECEELVSKWREDLDSWHPEQHSVNPCQWMELKCYDVSLTDLTNHLNDEFYGF
ncbi:hypothetical protein CAEBREN_08346 [Caenorhabditis brenneri]|uniref:Uncharacterized protein n=1 Tax=Caenorhabditis brenneri TaxID=135651 RepID=G0NNW9_CAEBE|nr:hypothetical protein CAEBREN_08346 [Caenorhabditis brenneri]